MEGVLWWMDGWRWRDQTVYTCQELETRATCSNLNNSFYWLEYIDWLQIYSFLKLPSLLFLPPSLPRSFSPSSLFSSPLCRAVSPPPADERIGSRIIPPCWVIGMCLPLFLFCIEALPAAVHAPLCVCVSVLVGVIGVIVIDWLYAVTFLFILLIASFFFRAPPPRAWEVQRGCSHLRPETLCSRPGRPWSSRTLSCWTSAPKCSCTGCCGRGPSDGRRPSGPAGEDLMWFTCR